MESSCEAVKGCTEAHSNHENIPNKPRVRGYFPRFSRLFPSDGYTWHKYAHKGLANNTYNRSYYKCTQRSSGCQARRAVDLPLDSISPLRITYSGKHNHDPRPQRHPQTVLVNHKDRDDERVCGLPSATEHSTDTFHGTERAKIREDAEAEARPVCGSSVLETWFNPVGPSSGESSDVNVESSSREKEELCNGPEVSVDEEMKGTAPLLNLQEERPHQKRGWRGGGGVKEALLCGTPCIGSERFPHCIIPSSNPRKSPRRTLPVEDDPKQTKNVIRQSAANVSQGASCQLSKMILKPTMTEPEKPHWEGLDVKWSGVTYQVVPVPQGIQPGILSNSCSSSCGTEYVVPPGQMHRMDPCPSLGEHIQQHRISDSQQCSYSSTFDSTNSPCTSLDLGEVDGDSHTAAPLQDNLLCRMTSISSPGGSPSPAVAPAFGSERRVPSDSALVSLGNGTPTDGPSNCVSVEQREDSDILKPILTKEKQELWGNTPLSCALHPRDALDNHALVDAPTSTARAISSHMHTRKHPKPLKHESSQDTVVSCTASNQGSLRRALVRTGLIMFKVPLLN